MPEEKIVQTPVAESEIGMYGAELDRPWSETPFFVQGFYVDSPEDIESLRSHCEFVFIDVYRTHRSSERRTDRIYAHKSASAPLQLAPSQPPQGSTAGAAPFRARAAD